MNKLKFYLIFFFCIVVRYTQAQLIEQTLVQRTNLAVPFLLLSSDAITSGMGEAGSALLSSWSTSESNTAKTNFLSKSFGVDITYTPWLKRLVNDRKLMFLGGFCKISPKVSLTASLNYLSYGQTDLTDNSQQNLGSIVPTEYAGSIGVSKSFGEGFSLGMKLKIVHSNLYSGNGNSVSLQPGTAYSIDLSSYHVFPVNILSSGSILSFAINVENIGPKISYYNQSNQKSYLPTNLKLATALKTVTLTGDEIGIAMDFNKLLVPAYQTQSDPSLIQSMISSFGSASGFKISDVSISLGAEYSLRKKVSFRIGYNLQGDARAPGSFFSLGLGFKMKNMGLNMAYLTGNPQRTFLSNTLRLSLSYSLPILR